MRKYVYIIIMGLFFSLIGSKAFGQKEIFIKRVDFKLDKISDIEYENEYFMSINLNKGSIYRFKIINHIDDFPGEVILELLDADKLVVTNIFNDKYFEVVNFQCNKSGFYDILLRFEDNKTGNCVIDIMLLQ